MWLAQTNLEVDTTVTYLLDGQEVYLTKPVKGGATQLVVKAGYEKLGRDTNLYELNYQRKRKLIKAR
jgi:hypothetical protein